MLKGKEVLLVASGDLRLVANQTGWQAQEEMESKISRAFERHGCTVKRAHAYNPTTKHGFIDSQKTGIEIFKNIDPWQPLVVAESIWQFTNHVLAGLFTHRGPVLTVANWSGTCLFIKSRYKIQQLVE